MKVYKKMLGDVARELADQHPAIWEDFKRLAEQFMDTTDQEVRVAFYWYWMGRRNVDEPA